MGNPPACACPGSRDRRAGLFRTQSDFMRTAITIGIRHDGTPELIAAPGVSIEDQTATIRSALDNDGLHNEFRELQYWTSNGGLQCVLRFKTPDAALP